jgi:hypothetical protein
MLEVHKGILKRWIQEYETCIKTYQVCALTRGKKIAMRLIMLLVN